MKLTLTDVGEKCLAHFEKILDEYSAMMTELNQSAAISVLSIPAQDFLARPLAVFEKLNPTLSVFITDRHGLEIVRAMKSKEFELAFIGSPCLDAERFDYIPIDWEPVGVILSADNPLASSDSVSLTELKEEKFYFMSSETGLFDFCCNMCLESGYKPIIAGTRSREDTILSLVRRGGATFMTEKTFRNYCYDGLCFVPLKEEHLGGVVLIKLKGRALSKHYKALWDFFANHNLKDSAV